MHTKVRRWGNSLALRIPKSFASNSRIKEGTTVHLSLDNGQITITAIDHAEYSLEDLLARVTKKNRHAENDFGRPVGRELL